MIHLFIIRQIMYFKSDLADYVCDEYLEFKITG